MRYLPSVALPSTIGILLLATQVADSATNVAPADPVVVRTGTSVLEASRIKRNFAQLREFQRLVYGTTPKAQLRGYVENVAVKDLLLAERGKKAGMLESARVLAQRKLILGDALSANLRAKLERESPISDLAVQNYYNAHPELFREPERIRILRLLVDTEAEAATIIEQVKQLPNLDDWRNLVREKSRDRATSERGGDIGFVAADGTTDVPELEVDAGLFAAAKSVKDGEVVRTPIPEGKRFAVVWRRGSLAGKTIDLTREAPHIRKQLADERLDDELRGLIAKLRQEHLRDRHPELLDGHDFAPAGESRPAIAAAVASPLRSVPSASSAAPKP